MADGKADRPERRAATCSHLLDFASRGWRSPSQRQQSSQTFALSIVQMTTDALPSGGHSVTTGGLSMLLRWILPRLWHRAA